MSVYGYPERDGHGRLAAAAGAPWRAARALSPGRDGAGLDAGSGPARELVGQLPPLSRWPLVRLESAATAPATSGVGALLVRSCSRKIPALRVCRPVPLSRCTRLRGARLRRKTDSSRDPALVIRRAGQTHQGRIVYRVCGPTSGPTIRCSIPAAACHPQSRLPWATESSAGPRRSWHGFEPALDAATV
jgi:hypothetical protein